MINSLYIKDFIIIEEQTIQFSSGLNIITGETGAGKSILIDAIQILMGERASVDQVRKNAKKAVIEGEFRFSPKNKIFKIIQELDFDLLEDNKVILRKEISARGNSRIFLNDSPIQITDLKKLASFFVDFHGQHDNVALFKTDKQTEIIDSILDNNKILNNYKKVYKELISANREYKALLDKESLLKEKAEFQNFQLSEIEKVDPKENEVDGLENELNILENAEFLYNSTNELQSSFYQGSNSVNDILSRSKEILNELKKIDPEFDSMAEDINSILITIKEFSRNISDYHSNIEFNPARIEDIRRRLLELKGLTKKFGSIESIIELKEKIKQDLDLVENFDLEKNKFKNDINQLSTELGNLGIQLHNLRKEKSQTFSEEVTSLIKELGMEKAKFGVSLEIIEISNDKNLKAKYKGNTYQAFQNGLDLIQFLISTNNGEELKPMNDIASGGELSRVMLAIKSIYAKSEELPILIFDEIDTGISGRIARKVGKLMKEISKQHQIISITHQAQIAAIGDNHILIEKIDEKGFTIAKSRTLQQDEKVQEIAKMISGENITKASLEGAKELMANK